MFFIDAPDGTGKTFLINLLLAKLKGVCEIAVAVASSGIAATHLPGGQVEGYLGTLEHLYLGQKRRGETSQRSNSFSGNEQLHLGTGNNMKNLRFSISRNTDIIRNVPYNLATHQEEKTVIILLKDTIDISTLSTVKRYDLPNLGMLKPNTEDTPVWNYPTGRGNGHAVNEVRHRSKRELRKYYKTVKGLLRAGTQLATSLTPRDYSTLAGEGLKVLGQMGGDLTERLIHSVGNGVKTYLADAGLENVDLVSGGVNALGTVSGKAIETTSNIVGETIKYVGSAFDKGYQTGKSLLGIVG